MTMEPHHIPLPAAEAGAATPRRCALLLSYRFPPSSSIACHRAEALYRHLPAYGWLPLVVTTRNQWAPLDVLQTEDRSWAAKLEGQTGTAYDPSRDVHPALRFGSRVAYAWQAVRGILRRFPRWHDRYAQWSYGIVDAAVAAGRQHGAQVVWATLSPLSLAPAAIRIARQLRVPCVLDLRDPPEEGLGGSGPGWFTRALQTADALTVAAPSCITPLVLHSRAGDPPPLILSGTWHPGPIAPEPSTQFRIVHAGMWHSTYDAATLFSALARLRLDIPDFERHCRAVFIGKGSEWVRRAENYAAAETMVELRGHTPYEQVQRELREASTLLIARGAGAYKSVAITGKIFDYVAFETPVLSIGGVDGMHAELVDWFGGGLWTTRVDEIAGFLRAAYARWAESGTTRIQRNPPALAYLNQRRMAGEFAAVLDAATNGQPPALRDAYPWAAEQSAP